MSFLSTIGTQGLLFHCAILGFMIIFVAIVTWFQVNKYLSLYSSGGDSLFQYDYSLLHRSVSHSCICELNFNHFTCGTELKDFSNISSLVDCLYTLLYFWFRVFINDTVHLFNYYCLHCTVFDWNFDLKALLCSILS